ncbi:MAG: Rieske 2Fe-2S domain-containing protein [Sterolibacterium sp.]|jgi:nitrite reductase/ring-hydroxylating ferredoxin subunit
MADAERLALTVALGEPICPSASLVDGGEGVRFSVERYGAIEPAFAIRHQHAVHAYLNRCGHIPVELDWQPGKFLDDSGLYLICSTHGALYAPQSGRCVGGRCDGKGLIPLGTMERDGNIYLKE